jgi:hypothetical protein
LPVRARLFEEDGVISGIDPAAPDCERGEGFYGRTLPRSFDGVTAANCGLIDGFALVEV